MTPFKKIKKPARIGFLCYVGDTQGCGTIRVIYPYFLINHFREDGVSFQTSYLMNYVDSVNWYKAWNFVQFQRSATEDHYKLILHLKNDIKPKHNFPIVYEIDDMLFNIPVWNYAAEYYNKSADVIKKIIGECDYMVTSTAKLKEVYSPYCKKISVIPNHLPKFIWGNIFPAHDYKDENEKIRILWAGSQNHFAIPDVTDKRGGDFGKDLIKFIKKTVKDYDWHIMGGFPIELNDVKGKLTFHPWKNVFEYPSYIKSIEPDICIAPLENIEFNKSKSNIKALEYTALGSPAVYSDVTPYKFMSLKSKTDEEMIYYIEKLASDIDYRAKIFRKDRQRISSQLWWEENDNIKRYINTYLNFDGYKL